MSKIWCVYVDFKIVNLLVNFIINIEVIYKYCFGGKCICNDIKNVFEIIVIIYF